MDRAGTARCAVTDSGVPHGENRREGDGGEEGAVGEEGENVERGREEAEGNEEDEGGEEGEEGRSAVPAHRGHWSLETHGTANHLMQHERAAA